MDLPPHRSLADEGPAMLGSPYVTAIRAYEQVIDHPLVSDLESDILGSVVYAGRLAAAKLADPDIAIGLDEYAALELYAEQGVQARRVLASRHLKLVMGLARNFSRNPEERAEMIGVGNVALMRCMEGYAHIPGMHFTPYAKRSVMNGMIAELQNTTRRWTGRSSHMQCELRDITAAHKQSLAENEGLSFLEIAERMGYSQERVEYILSLRARPATSLDAKLYTDSENVKVADRVTDPTTDGEIETVQNALLLEQVWTAACKLRRREIIPWREWVVFVDRFRDGQTQDQIAETLGVTQTAISALEALVVAKVKRFLEDPGSMNKPVDPDIRVVETPLDLLEVLGIEYDGSTDLRATARRVIGMSNLTALQKKTMHALLGTDSAGPKRPHEVAKQRGVTYRAVYDAREKAMRRLIKGTK